jgi:hypothetical protein
MSAKHKVLFFLLTFIAVGYVLNKRSTELWGASGAQALLPPTFKKRPDPATAKVGDIHKFYLVLATSPDSKLPSEFSVPEEVYNLAGGDGDQVTYEKRALPFLKREMWHYELLRADGRPAVEWAEGVVLFWGGLAGTAIAAGAGVVIVLTLIARLFGYGGNRD